jgi:hypothetical protein
MKSYNSNRTEARKARDLQVGDHILDPDSRRPRMMTVWNLELLGGMLYIDATLSRSVLRRVHPDRLIDVCIPVER